MNDQDKNYSTPCEKIVHAGPGTPYAGTSDSFDQMMTDQERNHIISITPEGNDPLIYWYHVAQDSIATIRKSENGAKQAREDMHKAQRAYDNLVNRMTAKLAEKRNDNPLDLQNLITMAGIGTIGLNISIGITHGEKERGCYDE